MSPNAKTYSAKPGDVGRVWFVLDATDQILGRLATRVATVIRGKHKPHYTPHLDVGDFVVVINAEKVKLTGNKLEKKQYRRHTGYPGGLVEIPYGRLLQTHPERAIESAVRGMLPKGRLGRQLRHKLKVYAGPNHPHESQKPEVLTVDGLIPVHVEPEPPRKVPTKDKRKKSTPTASKGAPKKKPVARKKSAPKKSASKPSADKEN